jgi:Tfp pilus assembly protein PilZ
MPNDKDHKPIDNVSNGYDGRLYDLDDGGIYFETNERLETGDKISITIKRFDNSEVTFDVEVLWRQEFSAAAFDYGYGVKAANPRAILRKVLKK